MKRREGDATKSVSIVLRVNKPRRSLMNHKDVFKFNYCLSINAVIVFFVIPEKAGIQGSR